MPYSNLFKLQIVPFKTIVMERNRLHLVKDGEEWAVKAEGSEQILVKKPTKEEADREGRKIAKEREAEFVIHGENNVIQDADSYGNDPSSSKDRKH